MFESLDDTVVAIRRTLAVSVSRCNRAGEERDSGDVPIRKSVFDMVQGRVEEHTGVVPRSRLDSDSLVDEVRTTELLVREHDSYHGILGQ